jgi:predicted dehydrogenase
MVAAAQSQPKLVAQVVPSPFGLVSGKSIKSLLDDHFIGDLREIIVIGADSVFWDYTKPLHWRQDAELSGKNILTLGIMHETLMRWAPPPVQVFAQAETFEPTRPVPSENRYADVTVPDSVQILTEHKGGARGIYHFSGVILHGPGLQIHLYGSRGTMKVQFDKGQERLFVGRANDKELFEATIPPEEQGKWQVEADFIASIREGKPVTLTDFKTGLGYMEFIEAVSRSVESNAPITLPLDE